jgi:hypothetical protein
MHNLFKFLTYLVLVPLRAAADVPAKARFLRSEAAIELMEHGGNLELEDALWNYRELRNKVSLPPAEPEAIYICQGSADLEIVSCAASSVEVRGSQSTTLTSGSVLVYMQDGSGITCSPCSPLFRKVSSVSSSGNGTTILSTTFATVGEMLGNVSGSAIANDPLEPMADCSHSTGNAGALRNSGDQAPVEDARLGECQTSWLVTNPDGRCTYTNCIVGITGDASKCFKCPSSPVNECDDGCGPASISLLNSDGNFGAFNFGNACCNHDYCWSSTQGKDTCDTEFYADMQAQCAPLPQVCPARLKLPLLTPPNLEVFPRAFCEIIAAAFYLGISFPNVAKSAFDLVQKDQQDYERSAACAAQCPSTQNAGVQGTTVLAIDLLRTSGTFPVSYNMYPNPDQLYIEYEGTRIFDTGGLVSNTGEANVTFSGNSTIILLTIYAPNEGTEWDVFTGCPF